MVEVQGDKGQITASFLCSVMVPLFGQKSLKCRQKECPKPTTFWICGLQVILFQQAHKKRLSEIGGRCRRIPSPTCKLIQGHPIALTEPRQSRFSIRVRATPCSDNYAPASCRKGAMFCRIGRHCKFQTVVYEARPISAVEQRVRYKVFQPSRIILPGQVVMRTRSGHSTPEACYNPVRYKKLDYHVFDEDGNETMFVLCNLGSTYRFQS